MSRRDLRLALSFSLSVALTAAGVSGVLADDLGLSRSAYHKYPAYLALVLGTIHLYLNRRAMALFLQQLLWFWRPAMPSLSDRGPAAVSPSMAGPPASRPGYHPARAAPWARLASRLHVSRRGLGVVALSLATGGGLGRISAQGSVGLDVGGDLGDAYHQWSKPGFQELIRGIVNWGSRPPAFKTYPGARRIDLPREPSPGLTLEEAIERRRSRREYRSGPLSLADLSRLLHYATGITDPGTGFRAAPSAGALYPIEVYPVVNHVESLPPGVYHYAVREHAVELVREGDFRRDLVQAAIGQEMVWDAQVVLVLAAVFGRTRWKYRERAYRYVLLDAGHLGQNVYLAATSAGLGACGIGAFLDDDLNHLLRIDGQEEAAIYMLTVGRV